MYYTGPPLHSYASVKVRGSSHSQTLSPPWSEQSFELSPLTAGPPTPSAPSLASVPLPSADGSSSTSSSSHGLMTPPTSPQANSRSIHPILAYDPTGRLLFNVNLQLTDIRLRPNFSLSVMNDQATFPPSSRVCINVAGFPRWETDIATPTGVTVQEVLHCVHELLFDRLVGRDEFATYSHRRQNAASYAFNARTSRDPAQRAQGIKRIDFLDGFYFVGLSRPGNGSRCWHINMAPQVAP